MQVANLEKDLMDQVLENNGPSLFKTADGNNTGWFISHKRCPDTQKMVKKEVFSFTYLSFFVAQFACGRLSLFVENISQAGRKTVWEYAKPIRDWNHARAVAVRICRPGEARYPYFRHTEHDGTVLWARNRQFIASDDAQLDEMGIPMEHVTATDASAKELQILGGLTHLNTTDDAPVLSSSIRSAFDKQEA